MPSNNHDDYTIQKHQYELLIIMHFQVIFVEAVTSSYK